MYQFNPLGNIAITIKVWGNRNLGKCLKPAHEWIRICPSPGSTDWSVCGRGWWEYSALHYQWLELIIICIVLLQCNDAPCHAMHQRGATHRPCGRSISRRTVLTWVLVVILCGHGNAAQAIRSLTTHDRPYTR